jgi:hypothetical protein
VRETSVSESSKEMVSSFENELTSMRFQDASSAIYESISAKRFVEARNRITALKSTNQSNVSKIQSIERELNSKATSAYQTKFTELKNGKFYASALLYTDSILMFESNNSIAINGKKELQNILTFLKERTTIQFDYWKFNPQIKNKLMEDFKQKSLSLLDDNSSGRYSYELVVKTDTFCAVHPSISWTSVPNEAISFGNESIAYYGLEPIEKYGYCANSLGTLSFDLSFSNHKFKTKYVQGDFRGNKSPDSEVRSFLESKHLNLSGKLSYTVSDVSFNSEQSQEILVTKFHTRGPQNAIYSLILPGLGSMIVTYGKKGYVPMLLWAGGLATIYYGSGNAAIAGALAVTTSYIWDFIATLVQGSKNLNASKSLRLQLRGDNSIKL